MCDRPGAQSVTSFSIKEAQTSQNREVASEIETVPTFTRAKHLGSGDTSKMTNAPQPDAASNRPCHARNLDSNQTVSQCRPEDQSLPEIAVSV